jgi:hypothetical protein
MTQTTITTTSDHDPSHPVTAKDAGRCTFRLPNRSRCRLPALNPHSGLCCQHASTLEPHDTDDLSMDLFGEVPEDELPELQTPEQISDFLARVVVLLAQGRITPRRATVFTYACSFLLRGAIFIDKNTVPEVIFDDPRPSRTDDHEPGRPEEPSPVLTGATR